MSELPELGSRERAVLETMSIYGLERSEAEIFLDQVMESFEKVMLFGSVSPQQIPPVGLLNSLKIT